MYQWINGMCIHSCHDFKTQLVILPASHILLIKNDKVLWWGQAMHKACITAATDSALHIIPSPLPTSWLTVFICKALQLTYMSQLFIHQPCSHQARVLEHGCTQTYACGGRGAQLCRKSSFTLNLVASYITSFRGTYRMGITLCLVVALTWTHNSRSTRKMGGLLILLRSRAPLTIVFFY